MVISYKKTFKSDIIFLDAFLKYKIYNISKT